MSDVTEEVFIGRDNETELALTVGGAVLADHTTITRMTVTLRGAGTVVDSAVSPALFDFTNTDKVVLTLGGATLPVGVFWADVVIYTALQPGGIAWGQPMKLRIS